LSGLLPRYHEQHPRVDSNHINSTTRYRRWYCEQRLRTHRPLPLQLARPPQWQRPGTYPEVLPPARLLTRVLPLWRIQFGNRPILTIDDVIHDALESHFGPHVASASTI
jgi:hypothetical protein